MAEQWWQRSALELASAIRTGEVTSVEVLDSHLARVEEVNGSLNAVVRVLGDEARAAAIEADRAVAAGGPLGVFHGVPISVKENLDVVGSPTTQGLPALAEVLPTEDAPVVERMRAAGAIPFVRTNLPDLGLRVHTDSALHGLTYNPWDHGRTAGGSSGGEASAIAAGMSPLGLGNDIGGSLRNPAYCCGVASIKPTAHRVPQASTTMPGEPLLTSQLMLVQGVLARRVADVEAGYRAIAGPHVRDPFCVPAPFDGPAPATPIKVALVPSPSGGSTDPVIAASVRATGEALAAAGYEVEEVEPPMVEAAIATWAAWLMADLTTMRPVLELVMSDDAMAFLTHGEAVFGATPGIGEVAQLLQQRHEIARAWKLFQAEYPLIVGPTWTQPPFHHGFDVADQASALATLELIRFVTPMNLLGLPVVCVPTGVANGLPLGVQVTGDHFREDLCLAAAASFEEAFGILTPIDPR